MIADGGRTRDHRSLLSGESDDRSSHTSSQSLVVVGERRSLTKPHKSVATFRRCAGVRGHRLVKNKRILRALGQQPSLTLASPSRLELQRYESNILLGTMTTSREKMKAQETRIPRCPPPRQTKRTPTGLSTCIYMPLSFLFQICIFILTNADTLGQDAFLLVHLYWRIHLIQSQKTCSSQ